MCLINKKANSPGLCQINAKQAFEKHQFEGGISIL